MDPLTGIHTFSADSTEIARLRSFGWREEGYAWSLLPAAGGESGGLQDVHRLFNPTSKDHLLTINDAEVTAAQRQGYIYEGVAGRALRAVEGATDVSFVQRFYRAASGEHFYTSNTQEAAQLTGLGFTNEGRAWAI